MEIEISSKESRSKMKLYEGDIIKISPEAPITKTSTPFPERYYMVVSVITSNELYYTLLDLEEYTISFRTLKFSTIEDLLSVLGEDYIEIYPEDEAKLLLEDE